MTRNDDAMLETLSGAGPSFARLLRSFDLTLAALNRTPRTRRTYAAALRTFVQFLAAKGMPADAVAVRREHVEAFIADLLQARTAKTALTYYASLSVFFRWLIEEGEIRESPMRRMKPPHVPETLAPVLSDDDVRRLLRACEGNGFEARRDTAIFRLFLDTGMRRAELLGIALDDVDDELDVVRVLGKGQRWRVCPFGSKTTLALDRYRRLRERHPQADHPRLWLGRTGPLSDAGLARIVALRGEQARLPGLHVHLFRHLFAHSFLSAGGQESDLLTLAGWRSRTMLDRYGRSAAAERARQSHRKLGIGDRY